MLYIMLSSFRYGAYYDLICGGLTSILCLVTIVMTSSTYLWLFTLCKIIDEFAWSILAPGINGRKLR